MSTSMSLDYGRIYRLSDPLASRPLRLTDEPYSEWLTRDQALGLFRGEIQLPSPLRLGTYSGGHPSDFLWAGLTHIICISQRVVDLLSENGITGWSVYPVEVFGRNGEPLPKYNGLSVIGPDCVRDRSRSQIVDKPPPVDGGRGYQVYHGLYFDENQWDGSDFFRVLGIATVVTDKVYRIFKRAKVTNVRFTPLTEVEIDVKLDDYE